MLAFSTDFIIDSEVFRLMLEYTIFEQIHALKKQLNLAFLHSYEQQ